MKRPTRSAAVGLAAALGLTIAVMPGVVSATGEATPKPPPQPAGTLSLSAPAGSVEFTDQGSTVPTSTQSLGSQGSNCIVPPSPVPPAKELMAFSGRSGALDKHVGYRNNLIGVNGEFRELCNLVDNVAGQGGGLEVLELKFGSGLKNFADRPLVATTASLTLAMNVKTLWTLSKPATVEVTAYLGESSNPDNKVGVPVTLTNGAPGCATTYGAICTLPFSPGGNFDRLQLKAVKGAFGLQMATFNLVSDVDAVADCETPITDGTTTVQYLGTTTPGDCSAFGVTLESTDTTVKFLKPSNVAQDAQFAFTTNWTIDIPAGNAQVPVTTVDFTNTGDNPVSIGWCQDATYTNGKLTGVSSVPSTDLDGNTLNGVQFACVGTQAAKAENGELKVEEQIYVLGDILLRKG